MPKSNKSIAGIFGESFGKSVIYHPKRNITSKQKAISQCSTTTVLVWRDAVIFTPSSIFYWIRLMNKHAPWSIAYGDLFHHLIGCSVDHRDRIEFTIGNIKLFTIRR